MDDGGDAHAHGHASKAAPAHDPVDDDLRPVQSERLRPLYEHVERRQEQQEAQDGHEDRRVFRGHVLDQVHECLDRGLHDRLHGAGEGHRFPTRQKARQVESRLAKEAGCQFEREEYQNGHHVEEVVNASRGERPPELLVASDVPERHYRAGHGGSDVRAHDDGHGVLDGEHACGDEPDDRRRRHG